MQGNAEVEEQEDLEDQHLNLLEDQEDLEEQHLNFHADMQGDSDDDDDVWVPQVPNFNPLWLLEDQDDLEEPLDLHLDEEYNSQLSKADRLLEEGEEMLTRAFALHAHIKDHINRRITYVAAESVLQQMAVVATRLLHLGTESRDFSPDLQQFALQRMELGQ